VSFFFSLQVVACKPFQHTQVPYCSLLTRLTLSQTLTVVTVLMEGEKTQTHRHATAGPLSLCLVVVAKVYNCNIIFFCTLLVCTSSFSLCKNVYIGI
jgi:hypothetical protein